jgi:hypothetical protein
MTKFMVKLDETSFSDRHVEVEAEMFRVGQHWVVFLSSSSADSAVAAFPTARVVTVTTMSANE